MAQDNNWQQQVWQQPSTAQTPGSSQFQGAAPYQQPPAPKKSRGWIVALVSIVLIFALIALFISSCTSIMSSSFGASGSSSVLSNVDRLSSDTVGIINIDGTIQYDGTTASPDGLKEQLDRAEKNSHIKAVVLRVNSGGGVATAGEEMSSYLRDFSKPVVVSSASTNASAAYEISSQADYIFTAKTTAIGAIGTVMQITDLSGLMDKLGISVDNVASSDSKDSSYGTRTLTEDERTYYQNMVNQINESFIQTVAEGRGMTVDEVRVLATGLTFTGVDAVNNGLADQVGTQEDAVAKAAELADISRYETVTLENKSSDLSDMLSLLSSSKNMSANDIAQALKELDNDGTLAR